jgi:hypothetical protein
VGYRQHESQPALSSNFLRCTLLESQLHSEARFTVALCIHRGTRTRATPVQRINRGYLIHAASVANKFEREPISYHNPHRVYSAGVIVPRVDVARE